MVAYALGVNPPPFPKTAHLRAIWARRFGPLGMQDVGYLGRTETKYWVWVPKTLSRPIVPRTFGGACWACAVFGPTTIIINHHRNLRTSVKVWKQQARGFAPDLRLLNHLCGFIIKLISMSEKKHLRSDVIFIIFPDAAWSGEWNKGTGDTVSAAVPDLPPALPPNPRAGGARG